MAGAVEMCSGLGACRKTLDGTMCPSYMATREEADVTRGRANVLRLAMAGRLGESGLGDEGVYKVLDLCLECRACKAECPVGVDVARFKSEFLADYWSRHGLSRHARAMSDAHNLARMGSRFAPVSNWIANASIVRRLNETRAGHRPAAARAAVRAETARAPRPARRRILTPCCSPTRSRTTTTRRLDWRRFACSARPACDVGLAGNVCCGRPKISKGVLDDARALAAENVNRLYPHVAAGRQVIFCEPSCLSAVREDAPDLLRGEAQRRARTVAAGCVLFEEAAEQVSGRLMFASGPPTVLLHGHCHQKSMGLAGTGKSAAVAAAWDDRRRLERGLLRHGGLVRLRARALRGVAGDCGTAACCRPIRQKAPGTVVVAAGTSCRHQVLDLAGETAVHPAVLVAAHLETRT